MDRVFPRKLAEKWANPHDLIQVFLGPRQVGKTTAAVSLSDPSRTIFFSADAPAPPPISAIEEQWKLAREIPSEDRTLILDEVQKVPGWSEVVKRLWDEDQRSNFKLRVAVLGSSALLIEKGLADSLTGRFEMNFFPHWTLSEVRMLRDVGIDEYMQLGGYPKAYGFNDAERAREYIEQSIVEPTLGRDILALHAVDKPALLRQLFWYVSKLPARIVSFDKILGSLQDRGNSATIAHYAELLRMAFLVAPIFKYSRAAHRTKRSLPKWIFPNPALIGGAQPVGEERGFLYENLVGAHLLNITYGQSRIRLCYWREENREIDYVVTENDEPILALEVKSSRTKKAPTRDVLANAGIDCPRSCINQENLEEFLMTTTIKDVTAMR